MRNELEYTIDYFEKGKDLKKKVSIKRINNEIAHAYSDLAKKNNNLHIMEEEAARMISEIGWIATSKEKDVIDEETGILVVQKIGMLERIALSKPVYAKLKEIKKEIDEISGEELLRARVKVINMIFDVNGIEDTELNSFAFWNKKTEPAAAWEFIIACIEKDNDPNETKKKE